jgi:hypothetical protein
MRPRGTPRPIPSFWLCVKPGAFITVGAGGAVGAEDEDDSGVAEAEGVDDIAPTFVDIVDIVFGGAGAVLCEEVAVTDVGGVLSGSSELRYCDRLGDADCEGFWLAGTGWLAEICIGWLEALCSGSLAVSVGHMKSEDEPSGAVAVGIAVLGPNRFIK